MGTPGTTSRTGKHDRMARCARAALALVSALGSLPLLATDVHADCDSPPLEVLWTYPEHGAVDVPTNAVFHSVSTTWGTPHMTLDGVALTAPPTDVPEGVPLGTLLPDHDYMLQLDYADPGVHPDAGGAARMKQIAFRTGAGPASKPAAVAISSTRRVSAVSDSTCPDFVAAQDCFDQGENTLLTFDVPEANGPGYMVDGELWPARCGDPSLFVYEDVNTARCHDVRVIGAGGLLSDTTRACPTPAAGSGADAGVGAGGDASVSAPQPTAAATEPESSSDACTVSRTMSRRSLSSWLLLGVSAFLFTRRRGRRSADA